MLRRIRQDAELLFEKQKMQGSEPRCLLAIAAAAVTQARLDRSLTSMILAPKGEGTITIMLRITEIQLKRRQWILRKHISLLIYFIASMASFTNNFCKVLFYSE